MFAPLISEAHFFLVNSKKFCPGAVSQKFIVSLFPRDREITFLFLIKYQSFPFTTFNTRLVFPCITLTI
jgi:hypothetical protein